MRPSTLCCLAVIGLLVVVYCAALDSIAGDLFTSALIGMGFLIGDASLKQTTALPAAAVSDPVSVASTGFDLGLTSRSEFLADCELLISAPALVVGDLANGETMTYDVYHDTAAGFGSETLLFSAVLTQTGAGGVGAAAATKRLRLPTDVKRYVRVKATNSGSGDASDKSFTAQLLF